MKKRNLLITSALILLAPTVLSLSQQNTKADATLVGRTNSLTTLVDSTGKTIENRGLAANTDWQLGKIVNINGNTYYQVATDEYAISTSITVQTPNTNTDTTPTDTKIGTLSYDCTVVDSNGNLTGSILSAGSSWKLGELKSIAGNNFYEVATNSYVLAQAVKITPNTSNNTNNNTSSIPMPNDGLIATTNVATKVYSYGSNSYGQTLPAGSAWKVSKLVVNKYGSYWGQIATDQYVWLGDVTINSGLNLKDNSEYIADFATGINK